MLISKKSYINQQMAKQNSSLSKSSQIKLPECPICIEAYNLERKRPYYICRNAHSMCKECYREHKLVNEYACCPICKCELNSAHRQNSDILALLEYHERCSKKKGLEQNLDCNVNDVNKIHKDVVFREKFKIPRVIQIGLLLTSLCLFPLLFVLISEFSYIVIGVQKSTFLFVYQTIISFVSFTWLMIWTFLSGVHSTCQTLFIYDIVFHIIYVTHMILIAFSLAFVLKLCAEKVLDEQWKVKGRDLRTIELPKNKIERHCFVVLVNFVDMTNRIFQIETHNK